LEKAKGLITGEEKLRGELRVVVDYGAGAKSLTPNTILTDVKAHLAFRLKKERTYPLDCAAVAEYAEESALTMIDMDGGTQTKHRGLALGNPIDAVFVFQQPSEQTRFVEDLRRVCNFVAGLHMENMGQRANFVAGLHSLNFFLDRQPKCCVCDHSGSLVGPRKGKGSHRLVYHSESGACNHCETREYWTSVHFECKDRSGLLGPSTCHADCLPGITQYLGVKPFSGVSIIESQKYLKMFFKRA